MFASELSLEVEVGGSCWAAEEAGAGRNRFRTDHVINQCISETCLGSYKTELYNCSYINIYKIHNPVICENFSELGCYEY